MSPYIQDIDLKTTLRLFKIMLFKHSDCDFKVAYRQSNESIFTELSPRYTSAQLAVESVLLKIIPFIGHGNECYDGCVVYEGCQFISEQEINDIYRSLE
ncbi:TPA: hypothetical protein N2941_004249 [Vibrio parahaemolyticus]|nr:hypothetical protein [Vibrio parahaemolyticus]